MVNEASAQGCNGTMKQRICGVILSGGQSSRMGAEKALLSLAGKPLIAHVAERLAPQVMLLAINANGDPARFAALGLPIIPDRDGGTASAGPLSGILAGLAFAQRAGAGWMVTAAADMPFLPYDLVARLAAAADAGTLVCLAQGGAGMEPLCALWRADALAPLEAAFAKGERAIRRAALALPHRIAPFAPGEPDPFLNLNTPDDLAKAAALPQRPPPDDR